MISQVSAVESDTGKTPKGPLPVEADFIYAYPTVPGYKAWRRCQSGTVFVSAFINQMKKLIKTEHFVDILTEVNREVAEGFKESFTDEETGKTYDRVMQMPSFVSTLTRKLYFH